MSDVKRGQLVKAAEELNEILKPSPPLNTKAKAPALEKKLIEAAELIHPKDKIGKDTIATLVSIGAEVPEMGKAKKEPKAKGKDKAKGKKGKGKAKSKDGVTAYKDRLLAAVEDLNSLDGLSDEIETEDLDVKDLEVEIKNAAEVVTDDDELEDDTWAVLYQLEVGCRYDADQAKAKKGKKGKGKAKAEPKAKKGKKEEPKGKGKAKAKKEPKEKKEKKPSNKAKACELWDGGKGMTDAAKISKKLKGAVQESTIKSWLASWSKGNRLPAGF